MSRKKGEKSVVIRVPIKLHQKIKIRGNGSFSIGLIKTETICEQIEREPSEILMEDVSHLMDDLRRYYSDNHYGHFDNFPAFIRMFLKHGNPDFSIMDKKRTDGKEKKKDERPKL